ncbi:hypothetical protein HHL28_14690 [Aerophototrophica crusticola]|uniref:Uncharacterized protein n=1 Tax=Aerophototrophica crusticola TaxID=1709002 RepID=A0A858RAG4_9PROT|nr:hypothetical protein HHL28_14690 [Rhodospirillaceae bacterium B3]
MADPILDDDPCAGMDLVALRQGLERLVELELSIVKLAEQAESTLPTPDLRAQAVPLLRDLRDLAAKGSEALEARLKALEAERGLYPDD